MAQRVMDQILQHGKVTRGYLGVSIQEVTPDLARAFKVPEGKGVLVGDVSAGSPGARAGLQKGDVIEAIDGEAVDGVNELRLRIASTAPGTIVHLKVLRNGQSLDVAVTLGELPENAGQGPLGSESENNPMNGVQVDELTPEIRREWDLGPRIQGVVVSEVSPDSPAAEAGLQRGDIIEEVNRRPIVNVSQYRAAIREAGEHAIVLLVNRGGSTTFMVIEPN